MSILLGKFNNNDFNLNTIINCYQDYFSFDTKNNNTYLYLDSKILKQYLKEGLEIKYRKYIFSFLKNIKTNNNIYYKILDINKITIDKNIYLNNLSEIDIENLEVIINLSHKIFKNKNKFTLLDKSIIKLDNKFYADTHLSRFLFSKKDQVYEFNGIIINYQDNIKNKILSLFSIIYSDNLFLNKIKKDKIQYNVKCTLILCNTEEIEKWKNIIKKYILNSTVYVINSKKDIKIKNKDILKLDFLIINTSFINNKYFKDYFYKYIDNIKSSLNISIINSLYDNILNKNIDNEIVKNLYLFKWNNIIFDDIDKIKNIDKDNYIHNLKSNVKYYLLNNNLIESTSDYIINNSINYHSLDSNIVEELDNFYFFLKKELLISNNKNININNVFSELIMSDSEKKIFNLLFENNKDNEKISLFLTNPLKYNFSVNKLENIYDILMKNIDESKIIYLKNIINGHSDKIYNCTICLENIEKNNFCIINCGHYFCKNCLIKYMNEKDNIYDCPNCRCCFNLNDVHIPLISTNNLNINYLDATKINKIREIINTNNKILILTEYKENIKIKEYLSDKINIYHLFTKNNYIKDKNKEMFNNDQAKTILFCNYNDILKYNLNINCIIFIDYPKVDINNTILKIKTNYLEKYILTTELTFYFLYFKDTFEELIIDKYIK